MESISGSCKTRCTGIFAATPAILANLTNCSKEDYLAILLVSQEHPVLKEAVFALGVVEPTVVVQEFFRFI